MFSGRWPYTVAAAAVMAAIVYVATRRSAAGLRDKGPRAGGAVILRRHSVEIDGESFPLRDDKWYLAGARLREDLALPVVEITSRRRKFERNGSERVMDGVVRVPVPRPHLDRARAIAEELKKGVVDDGD